MIKRNLDFIHIKAPQPHKIQKAQRITIKKEMNVKISRLAREVHVIISTFHHSFINLQTAFSIIILFS